MISRTVKLYPTAAQAARMNEWFNIGTGVWNWALGQHRRGRVPRGPQMQSWAPTFYSVRNATKGHGARIGFSSNGLEGVLIDVSRAWEDFRSGLRGQPKRKGLRNRLASIPFRRTGRVDPKRVYIPVLGRVKARGQGDLCGANILQCRLHRRPRGWYCTLIVEAPTRTIPLVGDAPVGIDLGYSTLATLSTGEKIEHPHELARMERRIGQADRGHNRRLLGRLQQRLGLARRSRNHAVSRDLVSRFGAIYVSRDNIRGLQRTKGKSVLSAGHGALKEMLEAKCRQAGRVYSEVPNRNSTRTCSACGCLDGPTGLSGLKVREWDCGACGAHHDRDVNAAVNTLIRGAALAHESRGDPVPEISGHR